MPITTDHKPDEPIEKLRIYHMGGFINEQKRVDGILTLSRSLGTLQKSFSLLTFQ